MIEINLAHLVTAEQQADRKIAAAWAALRAERDARLAASDWTQMPDASPPGGAEVWRDYRQALRDLPDLTDDPASPVWPQPPI